MVQPYSAIHAPYFAWKAAFVPSLVHDDIEDGDRERRHRPTLWAVHGIPQAINAGDTLFSLSRIALHRLTDLGFSDAKVLRAMRLYDETCLALCEGQYIDIATSESDELMTVDAYFDMIGRRPRRSSPRRSKPGRCWRPTTTRSSPATAGSAGRWASPSSSTTTCSGSGAPEQSTGKAPSDVAHRKKTLPGHLRRSRRRSGRPDRLTALIARAAPTTPRCTS